MSLTTTPPIAAALPLVMAIDALRQAEEALDATFDALAEIDLDSQGPIGSFHVIAYRETCRLFISIFAPAEASIGVRLIHSLPTMQAVRVMIEAVEDDPRNLPGLSRTKLALEFAVASLVDALDSIDRTDGADDWYGPTTAAAGMLEMIAGAIESSIVRRRGERPGEREYFGCN